MATSADTSRVAPDAGAATSSEQRRGTLRRHANLTRELAVTQFKLKYTGSVLGYVWSLVKPMMTFTILWIIFDRLFHIGRGSDRFVLQLLVAIVLFTFFQETTSAAMNSIASNGDMIQKAYFPRIILVVAATLSALMTFAINMTLIVLIAAPMGQISMGLRTLAAPFFMVELYVLVLGISMLLSSLFVFYRDLGHIWEILTQVLIYGSAVMYPLSLIHNKFTEALVLCNPVAQIIEDVRHALVTGGVPWSAQVMGPAYVVPFFLVAVLLLVGYTVFNRLTPRFAEFL